MLLIAATLLAFSTENADAFHLVKYLVLSLGAVVLFWGKSLYRTSLDIPIALYLATLTLVSIFSQDFLVNLIGQYQFYFSGIMPSLVLTGLFYASIGTNQDRLGKSFVYSMMVVSAIGIAQKLGFLGNFLPYEMPWGRIYSTIGSPVFLSCLLAMALPLALFYRLWEALPFLGIALILTQSRSGVLAAMVACAYLIGSKYGLNLSKKAHICVLSLILAVGGLGLYLATKNRPMGHTDLGRYHMARIAWKAFKAHPIVGYGQELFFKAGNEFRDDAMVKDLGASYNNCYAHNQFVHALGFTGILGFLAHVFLIGSIALFLYKTNCSLQYPAIGLFVYSMFQPTPLHAKAILAMMLGASNYRSIERAKLLEYSLRAILFLIAFYLIILFSADRLRMAVVETRSAYLWNQSVTLFPTVFR